MSAQRPCEHDPPLKPPMKKALNEPRTRSIASWPKSDRPREKLLEKGPQALGDSELLAILLRTGTRGSSAIALALELLRQYGTLRGVSSRLPPEFLRRGLGPAKAATLAAAFELGRRIASERDKPRARFRSSADAAAHFMPRLRDARREIFKIALLDTAHRLIKEKIITVGTLNLALVHPREVFREAVVESAAGVVLVHNHPGGDPAPSEEDVKLTRALVRAGEATGIPVLDHLIIGDDRYYSFADSRRLAG
jgi:DNA repair protein RadC